MHIFSMIFHLQTMMKPNLTRTILPVYPCIIILRPSIFTGILPGRSQSDFLSRSSGGISARRWQDE